jgi:hypothetical protein
MVGTDRRIPASELRRITEEAIARAEAIREALAQALQIGLIKEIGVDKRGYVVYERTNVP